MRVRDRSAKGKIRPKKFNEVNTLKVLGSVWIVACAYLTKISALIVGVGVRLDGGQIFGSTPKFWQAVQFFSPTVGEAAAAKSLAK